MHNSLLAHFVLLLSLFSSSILAGDVVEFAPGPVLSVRQSSTDPQCVNYERTANLSTVGANSTYRAAFLQASPVGTLKNSQMLDAAVKAIVPLTKDSALNTKCGNLTTLALTEAANNFTKGVVAQFSGIVGNPQAISFVGPELLAIIGTVFIIFGGVWIFMP